MLEKIVEYFQYWYKHRDKEDVPDMEIPVEICLEMLEAGEFLQMDRMYSSPPPDFLADWYQGHEVVSTTILHCTGVGGQRETGW